jgi:hypothetical protein
MELCLRAQKKEERAPFPFKKKDKDGAVFFIYIRA